MTRYLIIILNVVLILLSSCRNDEPSYSQEDNITIPADGVPVAFSLHTNDIVYETGYEPMKTASVVTADIKRARLSRYYRVLITKQVDNTWVIDTTFLKQVAPESQLESGNLYLTDNTQFDKIKLVLRPGKYKVTIFTGENSMKWKELKIGSTFTENDPPQAYGYRVESSNSYPTVGQAYLGEEIFTGTEDFVVEKTTDVHSTPKLQEVNITLNRAVGRFRVLLEDIREGVQGFLAGYKQEIFGFLTIKEGTEGVFCNGLDIWGKPWYDKNNKIKQMAYGSASLESTFVSGGKKYYTVSGFGRINSYCYFTEPGKTLTVIATIKTVTAQQGYPSFRYLWDDAISTIEHNTLSGVVFSPDDLDSDGYFNLILNTEGGVPVDAAKLFNPYQEYNQGN